MKKAGIFLILVGLFFIANLSAVYVAQNFAFSYAQNIMPFRSYTFNLPETVRDATKITVNWTDHSNGCLATISANGKISSAYNVFSVYPQKIVSYISNFGNVSAVTITVTNNCAGEYPNLFTTVNTITLTGNPACACSGTACNPANNGQKCDGCNFVSVASDAETCDNVDNNCNGAVDENLFNYGVCNQIGACFGSRETCTLGSWGLCSIVAQLEIFDNVDNNCNGVVDEGFNPPVVNIVSPVSGKVYNSSSLMFDVFTDEAVNNCRFSLDGALPLALIQINSTHFSNLVTIMPNGIHIISVNCTDANGQSTLASVNFGIDTIPPAINILSPNSMFYSTRDIPFRITSDGTQQTIWYNWNGTDQIYSSPETVRFNEGWNTITSYANDSVGNLNSRSFTFFVDSINPVLTITNPATNSLGFGTNDIPIEYSLDEANAVHCWWTNDSGATNQDIICGENITGQTWNEGSNTITVYAVDVLSHIASDTRAFNIDTLPPVINIITPTAGGIFGGNINFFATITDLNLDHGSPRYEIRENGVDGNLISSGALNEAPSIFYSNFSTDSSWSNRNLTLIVYASDTYRKSSSASVDFIVDNSVPSITFINPSADGSGIFNNDFNLNVLVQANLINETSYEIDDSLGNSMASNIVVLSQDSFSWNDLINISNFADGIYSLKVRATDSSIPADSVNAETNFTIDRTFPTITINSPVNQNYNYSCINVDVSLNSGDIGWFVWNNTVYSLPQAICTNFDEGSNTIEVYVNDSAGNVNNQNVTFRVDTIAPSIQFVDFTETDNSRINRNEIIVNTSASDSGSGVNEIYTTLYDAIGIPLGIPSISGPNPTESFSAVFASLGDGTYRFNSRACDNAGNCVSTETRIVTIDTIAPTLSIVSPINPGYNTPELNFEVSGDEPLNSCQYSLDGIDGVMNRIDATTFNASSGLLSEAEHSLNFSCTDGAGNVGVTNTISFNIDSVPPTLVINSPINQTYNFRDMAVDITSDGDFVWYNWNGTDQTYASENVRFNRWSNTLMAHASDSAGNTNSQSVTFFVDLPVTILDSGIFGGYYPYNVSEDVSNINFADSLAGNSSIEGIIPVDVVSSYIMRSNLTDLTLIYNCTAIDAIINGGSCLQSGVIGSDILNSNLTEDYVFNSSVSNSSIFNSTIVNAEIIDSNIDNSYIENSTIDDSIVVNASIKNGVLYCGNITFDSTLYVSDCINPINLADLIDYAPRASLSITPSSANPGDVIVFDASSSTDPNIPGALNDSLTYYFNFGEGTDYLESFSNAPDSIYDGIVNKSYGASGTYDISLIVTDKFGKTDNISSTIIINFAAPTCSDGVQNQGEAGIDCGGPCSACGGSGGSGGGGSLVSIAPGYFAGPGNKVYWPTGEQLANGYTVSMRLREIIKFFVEYKLYYFETTNLTAKHLGAEIRWPLEQQDFISGDDKKIDVNNDGIADVDIRLNSITSDGKDYFASITIKRIFGEGQTVESDVPAGTIFAPAQTFGRGFVQFFKNNWIIVTAVVLALIALAIVMVFYFRRIKMQKQNTSKSRR